MPKHTLIAYVEDVPGVLNRVSSLFRRRNFNIDSLAVGRTELSGVSRMTVVVDTTEAGARIVEANLYKLVNVLRVDDLTRKPAMNRELGLLKVTVTNETRSQVLQLVDVFRARVVDVDEASLVIEVTGSSSEIVYEPLPVDDPLQRQPDITVARTTLGWEPRIELREGLERTVAWYRENEGWWRSLRSGEYLEYSQRQYGRSIGRGEAPKVS
jgi:acetolactate synthase-1/3 small subunit